MKRHFYIIEECTGGKWDIADSGDPNDIVYELFLNKREGLAALANYRKGGGDTTEFRLVLLVCGKED